jgi:histidine decarboxylase
VTVPAVYLAQNVLPEGMDAFSLHGLPLVEWEKKLDLKELTFME